MAAYIASVTGNWASTATWGGSGPPVNGDSVTINTGITVTVAAGTTAACGTSPDNETTMDIIVAGTGRLIINGTLTCKGNVQISSGGTIEVVHTGGTAPNFIVDASHRPTTKRHHLRLGNAGTGRLIVTGLGPTQRAYVSGGTGATWYHNSTTAGQGQLDASYGYFTRGQNAGDTFGRFWLGGAISGVQKLDCSDSIFDDCGCFILKADSGKTITWRRNRWINTSTNRPNVGDGGINAAATVVWENNAFDKNPQLSGTAFGGSAAFRASNNYSSGGWGKATVGAGGVFDWTIKEMRGSASDTGPFQPAVGGTAEFYEWIVQSDTTLTNPQMSHVSGDRTCGGYLYQYLGTFETGEGSIPTAGAGVTFTLRNVLLLPNGDGDQTGTIASFLANVGGAGSNGLTNMYHITAVSSIGDTARGILIGETNELPTNKLDNVKSLLVFDGANSPPTSQGILYMSSVQASNDPARPAGVDYNWSHLVNCTTRTLLYGGTGGLGGVQSVPTAANDIINVNQNFIDKTRGMRSVAAWLGARIGASGDSVSTPGTAATIANFRLLFDNMWTGQYWSATSSDVANACALAIQWVTRGFVPTNAAGRALGHDGLTAGYRGAWAPSVTTPTVAGSTASCTTNAADGTVYWVITQSTTKPDWDRIIAGQDHTGAAVASGFSGSQAVSSTSIAINISGATLTPATNYYVHVAHSASATVNGDAAQPAYLRTSETVSSAAFQAAAGGARKGGAVVSVIRTPVRSPITSSIRSGTRAAA